MPDYQFYMYGLQAMWVVFLFALGACVGSLTNVLVYRLPLGMSVVTPPSRCPACDTRLTWRENIPIFGWLMLRGRCRFCRSAISPEYPIVEFFVAALFAAFFVLWYVVPHNAVWLDVSWGQIKPEWARPDYYFGWPRDTWPIFVVLLTLLGALTAMTIVDAKTFTIPLELPWFATVVAVVFHVGYAVYLTATGGRLPETAFGTQWTIPLPGWTGRGLMNSGTSAWWLGASFGAAIGLVIANVMLAARLIPRSFADYDEWEAGARAEAAAKKQAAGSALVQVPEPRIDAETPVQGAAVVQSGAVEAARAPTSPEGDHRAVWRGVWAVVLAGAALAGLVVVGAYAAPGLGAPKWAGLLAGALVAPLVYAVAMRMMEPRAKVEEASVGTAGAAAIGSAVQPGAAAGNPSADDGGLPPDMWIQYPHARREMFKEILFLAPAIALAMVGGWICQSWLMSRPAPPALWVMVLGGVLQGYLVAGAIVWAVRIFGSLGFGKEAMGLGDVHLLAAVGACMGWVDAALAFPLAAVVGLYWVLVSIVRTGGAPRAMPFGPYLAAATVLVILCKPLCERGLNMLLPGLMGQLPINLP